MFAWRNDIVCLTDDYIRETLPNIQFKAAENILKYIQNFCTHYFSGW